MSDSAVPQVKAHYQISWRKSGAAFEEDMLMNDMSWDIRFRVHLQHPAFLPHSSHGSFALCIQLLPLPIPVAVSLCPLLPLSPGGLWWSQWVQVVTTLSQDLI